MCGLLSESLDAAPDDTLGFRLQYCVLGILRDAQSDSGNGGARGCWFVSRGRLDGCYRPDQRQRGTLCVGATTAAIRDTNDGGMVDFPTDSSKQRLRPSMRVVTGYSSDVLHAGK